MMRASDMADLFDKLANQNFLIDAHRCVSVRNKNIACNKCADACVSGCIQIHEHHVLVDTSCCIHCGTCATACPTGAIQVVNPSDDDLMTTIQQVMQHNAGILVVACNAQIDRAKHLIDPVTMVHIPCLGRIDESLLLAAAALGASRITLVSSDCENCPYGKGLPTITNVYASANALLTAWQSPCKLKMSQKFPKLCANTRTSDYDFQRRDFLLSAKRTVTTSGQEATGFMLQKAFGKDTERVPEYEHVCADGTLPHYRTKRRALLSSALTHLGTPPESACVKTRLWRRASIDTHRCNGCQMCAVFCPSAALAKRIEPNKQAAKPLKLYRAPGNPRATQSTENNVSVNAESKNTAHVQNVANSGFTHHEKATLVHAPSLCVNCECCVQLCPQHAITLKEEVRCSDLLHGYTEVISLKNDLHEKGGPNSIRTSMSKLINSASVWG